MSPSPQSQHSSRAEPLPLPISTLFQGYYEPLPPISTLFQGYYEPLPLPISTLFQGCYEPLPPSPILNTLPELPRSPPSPFQGSYEPLPHPFRAPTSSSPPFQGSYKPLAPFSRPLQHFLSPSPLDNTIVAQPQEVFRCSTSPSSQ